MKLRIHKNEWMDAFENVGFLFCYPSGKSSNNTTRAETIKSSNVLYVYILHLSRHNDRNYRFCLFEKRKTFRLHTVVVVVVVYIISIYFNYLQSIKSHSTNSTPILHIDESINRLRNDNFLVYIR